MCFKASIDGFNNGCRPFLDLDDCHLKSKYLSTLLLATTLDGNNGLFLVVFEVVEGESGDTRYWFLQNLLAAFQESKQRITFIYDQEKWIQESIVLMPNGEHRVCVRRLWKSFKEDFSGEFYEQIVWDVARAFREF